MFNISKQNKLAAYEDVSLPSIDSKSENYNFVSSNKGNRRPSSKFDTKLVEELTIQIKELKIELEEKNKTISSIQRNFESISGICKNEKQKSSQLSTQNFSLENKNSELTNTVSELLKK